MNTEIFIKIRYVPDFWWFFFQSGLVISLYERFMAVMLLVPMIYVFIRDTLQLAIISEMRRIYPWKFRTEYSRSYLIIKGVTEKENRYCHELKILPRTASFDEMSTKSTLCNYYRFTSLKKKFQQQTHRPKS